jgi:hypothetical protein
MVAFSALAGWAIEWQMPPECDEDAEQVSPPHPARDSGSESS